MDDVLTLARLQFALTAIAHYLFVSLTLGLVTFLVVMQTRWAITGKDKHRAQTRFWGQLYLINYALGIGTGIVMEFQFGLNWSGLTHAAGNVFGAPLAVETLVAFFAESTLLGIWIFGWDRLGRTAHTVLIWLVALTAYASVFFVMAANGFLQNPARTRTKDGEMVPIDAATLFQNTNASSATVHVLTSALTTGAFFVVAVSAWHLRKRTAHTEFFWSSMKLALPVAAVMAMITGVMGASLFQVVAQDTPTKFGPGNKDAEAQAKEFTEKFGPDNYFPPDYVKTAESFMISSWGVMMVLTLLATLFLIKRNLIRRRILLWLLSAAVVLPYLASTAGWIFREAGRQPWAVYGVLKTEEAVTPGLTLGGAITSLLVFGVLVAALTLVDWALLIRFARKGPDGTQLGAAPPAPDEKPADVPQLTY
ncbi:cytochrome ubiquinol oxidase subunit I [Streptomyces sp. NPDC050147]|uniref:cytochrome ubiquinol oxidase subunit I n=1 Tax=Streptomyces sp. NPDC050147 TaxID=3155513 RepID=UPI0034258FA2